MGALGSIVVKGESVRPSQFKTARRLSGMVWGREVKSDIGGGLILCNDAGSCVVNWVEKVNITMHHLSQ